MAEVLKETPIEGVALLKLNRPEVLNALSVPLRLELAAHIDELNLDPAVRAIVITGDEKAFAAGADLTELKKRTVRDAQTRESVAAWVALRACTKPVIAAVNGFALGGGSELAFHCDIIIAGEGAKFGLPEVKVGIMPGAGGTQRLVRAVGKFKASRYLLTGDLIPAEVAYTMGIVSEVVPDDQVIPHALKIASKIAALPPLAVQAIKEAVGLGPDASLDTALALERKTFQLLFTTEDRDEGIAAFLEKRKPVFKGR
ncbi:enoyl-CoA hydratase-related protein [Sphingomonas montanisoli]|uniref:Enoyl-CoA hydratase n=1 Tax=Sphingomonas montanisoli TaxID=2606412 RepID=A0A5D9BYP0_9SPHN|nr:enoyl-CoA hydratase-related protein [Sphingomonas montanisoli]TZG24708.1 enoyl-CoA hydratase [Sphingomonas montanisoli]